MEEIKIIKQQLKKLARKGIALEIINDTVYLIDSKKQVEVMADYSKCTNVWDGIKKDYENYSTLEIGKFVVAILS